MKNFFTFLALFLTVAILTGDALRAEGTWTSHSEANTDQCQSEAVNWFPWSGFVQIW